MDRIFKLPVGVALFAFLALAGLMGMLAVQSVMAQDTPPTSRSGDPTRFDYAENRTDEVHRYGATDPENKKIFWTLGGTDAADFTIVGGYLRFKSPPDYENPTDRVDADSTPLAIPSNNIYRVTVRFGAGGEDGMPGTDGYDGDDLGEIDVTVTVINENEDGMVHISSLQPQVGTGLTATVTDLDGVAVTGSWQWASGYSKSGPFTDIPDNSGDSTYSPVDADLGKYLRVTVRYRDNVSGSSHRAVSAVSAYTVRRDIVTSNTPPSSRTRRR